MFKDFSKYEKLEHKKNKLKLDIDFVSNCKQFDMHPKFLIFNLAVFQIKTFIPFVKGSFIAPLMSVIKNFNMF